MTAYYNEIDAYAAAWLRNLINAGHLPAGEVDTRSIVDVRPDDLAGFSECHFFAGIGGWPLALRLAGWPADRDVWTGSCPCQPFSVAGKGLGAADERHLWPVFFNLIRARRPAVVMGEQVAAAVGKSWLDGVCADLEGIGYACGAAVVPACAVDAPHRRDRLWFVAEAARHGSHPASTGGSAMANTDREGRRKRDGGTVSSAASDCKSKTQERYGDAFGDTCAGRRAMANAGSTRREHSAQRGVRQGQEGGRPRHGEPERHGGGAVADANGAGSQIAAGERGDTRQEQPAAERDGRRSAWAGAEWIVGADGKARRVEPSIRLLAHGVPARVGQLRAYGNAIVPQVAAEVIGAYLECRP